MTNCFAIRLASACDLLLDNFEATAWMNPSPTIVYLTHFFSENIQSTVWKCDQDLLVRSQACSSAINISLTFLVFFGRLWRGTVARHAIFNDFKNNKMAGLEIGHVHSVSHMQSGCRLRCRVASLGGGKCFTRPRCRAGSSTAWRRAASRSRAVASYRRASPRRRRSALTTASARRQAGWRSAARSILPLVSACRCIGAIRILCAVPEMPDSNSIRPQMGKTIKMSTWPHGIVLRECIPFGRMILRWRWGPCSLDRRSATLIWPIHWRLH